MEAELLDPLRPLDDLVVAEADLRQIDADLDLLLNHRIPAHDAATARPARAAQQAPARSTRAPPARRSAPRAEHPPTGARPSVRRSQRTPQGSARSGTARSARSR